MYLWLSTVVFGVIIIFLLKWLSKSHREYFENNGIPYINSSPIFGVLFDFLRMKKSIGEIIEQIYWNHKNFKYIGYFMLTKPTIIVLDPEIINHILIKDFSYFEDRGHKIHKPTDLFSLSVGNLTGNEWRNVRNKLVPAFTTSKMKVMFNSMKKSGNSVNDFLKDKTNMDLDARDLMLRYLLNIIGDIAFGLNIDTLNSKEEKSCEFMKLSSLFFTPSLILQLKFFLSVSIPNLSKFIKISLTNDKVETFFRKLTNDVINYRETNNIVKDDFLQILLDQKKKELSNIETADQVCLDKDKQEDSNSDKTITSENIVFNNDFIAAQTFIFITGGSESVAITLSFVFYELAQNLEIQQKVHQEISSVLNSEEFTYEAVKKMKYLDKFIYETFRLHPLGSVLGRLCIKDYYIPGTESIIPKGTAINIPIAALQTDPKYYEEPNKFNPDRFDDSDGLPKNIFFPFGIGPRMCIASRLAMLEMKVILALVLSTYSVSLSDKTVVPLKLSKSTLLTSVEGGIWVKFHERDT